MPDFGPVPFDLWCDVVSLHVRRLTGHALEDAPTGMSATCETWYMHGLSAFDAAMELAPMWWDDDRKWFGVWCDAVNLYLARYTDARTLADLPAECAAWPETWYLAGVPARIVASGLSVFQWPPRATLTAFYTDAQIVRAKESLAGSSAWSGKLPRGMVSLGAPVIGVQLPLLAAG